ncbi:uncharacterized protein BO80DRAFT_432857 [Aspergillus ibericus CBS 121593]|uniref:Uncharacterized protein n=1 Tax=Aspergillus ibericus CBS 121593 TaxID=1448316 RepID=A0A395H7J7_9EURO|nr:hypothetical protein BO80DRAFT_432857 [Aspergillus ibericus CBS 121593]RAL03630.1 hypothetical protein BO80DRAFT_432857 [Aspergillus ibericus CBS 121593]
MPYLGNSRKYTTQDTPPPQCPGTSDPILPTPPSKPNHPLACPLHPHLPPPQQPQHPQELPQQLLQHLPQQPPLLIPIILQCTLYPNIYVLFRTPLTLAQLATYQVSHDPFQDVEIALFHPEDNNTNTVIMAQTDADFCNFGPYKFPCCRMSLNFTTQVMDPDGKRLEGFLIGLADWFRVVGVEVKMVRGYGGTVFVRWDMGGEGGGGGEGVGGEGRVEGMGG